MDSELFRKFSGITVIGTIASGIQLFRDIIIAVGDSPKRWQFAFDPLFRFTEDAEYLPQFGKSGGFYPPNYLIDLSRFKGFKNVCYKCYLQGTDFGGKDIRRERNAKRETVSVIRFRPTNAKVCSHYYMCPHFKRALELSDMSQFSEDEKEQLDFYLNSGWEAVVALDILVSLIELSTDIDVDNYYTNYIYELVELAFAAGVEKKRILQYETQYLDDEYGKDVYGSPINCRKYIDFQ